MPAVFRSLAPLDAIAALETRGLDLIPTFAWQDVYAAEHAAMFTVAKSAGFDILEDIYQAVLDALAGGQTLEQFSRDLKPTLQRKGWWGAAEMADPLTGLQTTVQLGSLRRLKTIFDVNMRVSYAAGQWTSIERNIEARPFLRYVHLVGQENPRLHHKALHNIVLPADHPFWDTHFAPNGWNCHCTIQSLSQRDIDRLIAEGEQLRFDAPEIEAIAWTNPRTGEVRYVPEGIDPGWDYNPGKAGHQATVERIARMTRELF